MLILRGVVIAIGLILLWALIGLIFNFPSYILPTPSLVFSSLWEHLALIFKEAGITFFEAILGFFLSMLFGCASALFVMYVRPAQMWFLPILLISQALPTFAIAPLFVIWFGYGMASKVAITMLMVFFPITSAFYDGLRRTPACYLDLAHTMGGGKWRTMWLIQVPSSLPSLGTGLRVAATFAPMGAVIGEWVGSSEGLGFLILNANARMQIALMFAVLMVLVAFTLLFYFAVDYVLKRLIYWEGGK